jgi:hypothetical protein
VGENSFYIYELLVALEFSHSNGIKFSTVLFSHSNSIEFSKALFSHGNAFVFW